MSVANYVQIRLFTCNETYIKKGIFFYVILAEKKKKKLHIMSPSFIGSKEATSGLKCGLLRMLPIQKHYITQGRRNLNLGGRTTH